VLAYDLQRRRRLWRYAPEDRQFPFYSSAALGNGRIVLGGRDKFVHALDSTSGKPVWTFATRARVDSSPVIAGGRVYVGSNDGRLYVLDRARGTRLAEFDAGAAITASPALGQGRLVVGATDGQVFCFA
jgi:outer membrane protein assembly factor BamB